MDTKDIVKASAIAGASAVLLTAGKLLADKLNAESSQAEDQAPRRLIIDTDTGGDDAMALLMAALSPNIIIEGITVAAGNVSLKQAADNALMTLEVAGCNAPVYLGSASSYTGEERECFSVYGKDGMGDHDMIHPSMQPQEGSAIDYIIDTVKKNPGEIEIVALGPVANLALAFDKDPEAMKQVKRIWSMGTAGLGPGNATPVAEFNVYKDAEAYDILLKSGVPISIIGLDLCEDEDTLISADQLESMIKGNPVQSFSGKAYTGLLEFRRNGNGQDNVDACDAIAMAHVLWPDFTTKKIMCNAVCITQDCPAYGQVIFYRSDRAYDSMPQLGEPNIELIAGQQGDQFFKRVNKLFKDR